MPPPESKKKTQQKPPLQNGAMQVVAARTTRPVTPQDLQQLQLLPAMDITGRGNIYYYYCCHRTQEKLLDQWQMPIGVIPELKSATEESLSKYVAACGIYTGITSQGRPTMVVADGYRPTAQRKAIQEFIETHVLALANKYEYELSGQPSKDARSVTKKKLHQEIKTLIREHYRAPLTISFAIPFTLRSPYEKKFCYAIFTSGTTTILLRKPDEPIIADELPIHKNISEDHYSEVESTEGAELFGHTNVSYLRNLRQQTLAPDSKDEPAPHLTKVALSKIPSNYAEDLQALVSVERAEEYIAHFKTLQTLQVTHEIFRRIKEEDESPLETKSAAPITSIPTNITTLQTKIPTFFDAAVKLIIDGARLEMVESHVALLHTQETLAADVSKEIEKIIAKWRTHLPINSLKQNVSSTLENLRNAIEQQKIIINNKTTLEYCCSVGSAFEPTKIQRLENKKFYKQQVQEDQLLKTSPLQASPTAVTPVAKPNKAETKSYKTKFLGVATLGIAFISTAAPAIFFYSKSKLSLHSPIEITLICFAAAALATAFFWMLKSCKRSKTTNVPHASFFGAGAKDSETFSAPATAGVGGKSLTSSSSPSAS